MRCAALGLLLAILIGRVVATYGVFNDVVDESFHIAAGLEALQEHTYTLESQHPPLGRVAVAALPYFWGVLRSDPGHDLWGEQGAWKTCDDATYWRSLALARAGNLLFAVLAAVVAYRWAVELFGGWAGVGAAALVTMEPNFLAHAGLATLDISAAATVLLAAYCFWRWSQEPGWRWCLASATAFSAAVLTKFSALAFLPPIALLFFTAARGRTLLHGWRTTGLRAAVCVVIFWVALQAIYGFPVRGGEFVPSRFANGLEHLRRHNAEGHRAYLLGRFSDRGWWYYFPVAVGVKTTFPFLLLTGIGIGLLGTRPRAAYPLAAAAVVLAVAMASNLNIGIRHVLVLYPFLAIVAAGAFTRSKTLLLVAVLLVAWHAGESVAAHPDYLGYFNQIARGREERFLIDSNLDWGQDLARLALYQRDHGIGEVYLNYFGRTLPSRVHLNAVGLTPEYPPIGWAAISVTHCMGLFVGPQTFAWYRERPPTARVGKSILLYRITDPHAPPAVAVGR
jgi:4-amino-4-deoxy-L-arabinose transferase-like glycosyltransferase